MKVNFDATFEDFVDVHKRAAKPPVSQYLALAAGVVLVSGAIAGLMYLAFQDWLAPAIAGTFSLIAGIYAIAGAQDKSIRTHLKRMLDVNAPVPTEVEINEAGVTTRCLGQTVTQDWSTIENIEETDDAIYFRNKFGGCCSARKRGFDSETEMKQFLDLAQTHWRQGAVPAPPSFESSA